MTVHAPIQADFRYDAAGPAPAGMSLCASIFADRAHLRDTMREDALAMLNKLVDIYKGKA